MPRNNRGQGRGGPRQGVEGRAYSNRSDLNAGPRVTPQPRRAVGGQTYGKAGEQLNAQRAVPLPQVVPLDAPTARPDEPVTAGLERGPGPGPDILGLPDAASEPADELLALYQRFPSEGLRRLIEDQ